MGWKLKTVVILALGIFVAGCLWLGYMVYARYQGNDYLMQMPAAFNAALLVNGDETYTEPDKAVICAYEGQRYVILPDNYKAIVSLLRKDSAMPLFRRVGDDAPLTIVCDVPAGWTKARAHCQLNARKGADAADLEVPAKDGRAVFDIPRDWIGVSVRKAE